MGRSVAWMTNCSQKGKSWVERLSIETPAANKMQYHHLFVILAWNDILLVENTRCAHPVVNALFWAGLCCIDSPSPSLLFLIYYVVIWMLVLPKFMSVYCQVKILYSWWYEVELWGFIRQQGWWALADCSTVRQPISYRSCAWRASRHGLI